MEPCVKSATFMENLALRIDRVHSLNIALSLIHDERQRILAETTPEVFDGHHLFWLKQIAETEYYLRQMQLELLEGQLRGNRKEQGQV